MAIDTLSFKNCENLNLDCRGANALLPLEKQKETVTDLIFRDKLIPPYEFIKLWNEHNPYYYAPEGIIYQSSGSINNSFIIISAADSSVVDNGIEFSAINGRLVIWYGYNLTVPKDDIAKEGTYCSSSEPGDYNGPPINEHGECATKYTSSQDKSYLEVFQDSVKISSEMQPTYTLTKGSTFEARLNIIHNIESAHYEWKETGCCQFKYCCYGTGLNIKCGRFERCGCEAFEYTCSLDRTETDTDTLAISNSKTLHPQLALAPQDNRVKVIPTSKTIKATISIDTKNAQSYEIVTQSQKFKKVLKSYSIKWKHPPFNSFYLEMGKGELPYTQRLYPDSIKKEGTIEKITFSTTLEDLEQCSFTVHGFFNSTTTPCNLIVEEKPTIPLETDQWVYSSDEIINLAISFDDNFDGMKSVLIQYGNQTLGFDTDKNKADVQLTPMAGQSLILVRAVDLDSEAEAESSINITVYDRGTRTAIGVAIFLFIISFILITYFTKLSKPK